VTGYRVIVWATDGSPGAEDALVEAIRLAELTGARIVAVHCDQHLNGRTGGWSGHAESDKRQAIADRVLELQAEGVDIELILRRTRQDAADTVALVADEVGADLVVCGTRGLGALAGALLGSFTQQLLHVSPCPVLAVPEGARRAEQGSVHATRGGEQ
jgi:nucleotide-binding universal stress UspA family protein